MESLVEYVEVFDEMKIKEAAVYDKHESKIDGFVNLALMSFEQSVNEDTIPVATRVLAFMVRGLFIKLIHTWHNSPLPVKSWSTCNVLISK